MKVCIRLLADLKARLYVLFYAYVLLF